MQLLRLWFEKKVFLDGKMIDHTSTHSKRLFFENLRSLKWQLCPSVYIRVNYGMKKDVHGKSVMFYNDGIYTSKKELFHAFRAFIEDVKDTEDDK
jgi:hypothetical protein